MLSQYTMKVYGRLQALPSGRQFWVISLMLQMLYLQQMNPKYLHNMPQSLRKHSAGYIPEENLKPYPITSLAEFL